MLYRRANIHNANITKAQLTAAYTAVNCLGGNMFLKTNSLHMSHFAQSDKDRNFIFNSMLNCADSITQCKQAPYSFASIDDEYMLYRYYYKEKYACSMRPVIHLPSEYTWEQVIQYMKKIHVSLRPTFVKHIEDEASLILRSYSFGKLSKEKKISFIQPDSSENEYLNTLGDAYYYSNSLDGAGLNFNIEIGKQCLNFNENSDAMYEKTLNSIAERIRWINKEDIFNAPIFKG